jgi:hypothetical protein
MSGDLNDFLRQAAERREARKRAEAATSQPPPKPLPRSSTPSKTVEASELLQPLQPGQTRINPHIPAKDHLAEGVASRDRERQKHQQEVFGHHLEPLAKSKQPPKEKAKGKSNNQSKKKSNSSVPPTIAPASIPTLESSASSAMEFETQSANAQRSELLSFLRNPQSLKTAFIASEIFRRKFD